MGLAERRIAAAYEKEQLPAWKKKIEAVAGAPVELDVKLEPLVKEQFISEYPQILDYNFFAPLEKAFQGICIDDMGKDALKAKIKKVRIQSAREWSSLEVSIEGDTLVLDADPTYNRAPETVDDYAQRIKSVLEKAL
jgi:hypothetical protein